MRDQTSEMQSDIRQSTVAGRVGDLVLRQTILDSSDGRTRELLAVSQQSY
jgi:hypothetical protein